jgi:hypothetical protein
MKKIAIITCVNHSDYLRFTLPFNRWYFDEVYILTSSKDKSIHHLASIFDCKIFSTEKFYENGTFNRGSALNHFLEEVSQENQWVFHLDSDIILKKNIEINDFNPKYLYSQRRMLIYTVGKLYDFLFSRSNKNEFECPPDSGWGYLQIFNTNFIKNYPCNYSGCRDSDSEFRSKFEQIITLEEDCIHLGPHGQNHFERITEEFKYDN